MRTYLNVLILGLLAAVALAIYLDWTTDRRSGPLLSDLRTLPIHSKGRPGLAGNLLGIETRLLPADYQSRERLRLKFATYLRQARDANLLNARTVVVLPEHVGTGLFAVDEKPEVQQARTLRDAMQWTALSNPWEFLRALLDNQADDRRTEAVLRISAPQMAKDYQDIFGSLAREFAITLVAGSIVLPEPRLRDDVLITGDGPLRHVSLTFDRRGKPLGPLQYKQALSRYERRYSAAPGDASASLIDTPAGRMSVLLGCDAHYHMPAAGAELVAHLGAMKDPSSACSSRPAAEHALPRMEVRTLGLPWNLVGSPRKPARHDRGTPVQLNNLWLPERS